MKPLSVEVTNFSSYQNFLLDLERSGLTLIYGATGSGKSTIADMLCWVLTGSTAKEGSVDDVKSWCTPEDPTTGIATVSTSTGKVIITRVRGKTTQNDLYWIEEGSEELHRGKDLTDTQKLLDERLGIASELYLNSAYFSEFSRTANFFSSSTRDKRELLEHLASLDLPTNVSIKITSSKQKIKKDLEAAKKNISHSTGRRDQLNLTLMTVQDDLDSWRKTQENLITELKIRSTNFEKEKSFKITALDTKLAKFELDRLNKISVLQNILTSLEVQIIPEEHIEKTKQANSELLSTLSKKRCPQCESPIRSPEFSKCEKDVLNLTHLEFKNINIIKTYASTKEKLFEVKTTSNPYLDQVKQAQTLTNQYHERLQAESDKKNPFMSQIHSINCDIKKVEDSLVSLNSLLKQLTYKKDSLDQLQELTLQLRAQLLKKAVEHVQNETNRYLDTYFDAELRINLSMPTEDKLEVSIQKNGYECSYPQLSKGQRGLLKLAFTVTVMESAANKSGVNFDILFFDEALDGLDDDLKIKAFSLFQELQNRHSSIFIIDHCEAFQNLFDNKMHVELVGDYSTVVEEL